MYAFRASAGEKLHIWLAVENDNYRPLFEGASIVTIEPCFE